MGKLNKSLGCSVDEQTYWEFKTYTKQDGLSPSDKLKELIAGYLVEKTQPVPKEVLVEVEKTTDKMTKPKATEKQIAYINYLYTRLGMDDSLRQTASDVFEADRLIKALRTKLYGAEGMPTFQQFEQMTMEALNA